MLIESIELFHVELPLKSAVKIVGRAVESLETVIVKVSSGGISGWGEASPGNAPTGSEEWAAGCFKTLRNWFGRAIIGWPIDSGAQLTERLAPFRGNRHAKAALDMAWWDLHARMQGKPLHEVIGGTRTSVAVGPTFDRMESTDEFIAAIGRALAAGYARVKLKIRPGWDIEMLRAVRHEFGTETIHVDCEGILGLQHMEMLCRMEDFSLAMIEQPLAPDDLVAHAMLQETLRTPVCLGESITTPAQAEMAFDLKSCRSVNIQVGRVGGMTAALEIYDACHAGGFDCWSGAAPQSTIGARFGLALAAKADCNYPADYFPSEEVLAEDLAEPLLPRRSAVDGLMQISLWSEPGIGFEPDLTLIGKYSHGFTSINVDGYRFQSPR